MKVSVYGSLFGEYTGDFEVDNATEFSATTKPFLRIHSRTKCLGRPCPFHNPSDHPLREAPMNIRLDKSSLVERVCKHGIGHSDPDSVAFLDPEGKLYLGVHGCCEEACCAPTLLTFKFLD